MAQFSNNSIQLTKNDFMTIHKICTVKKNAFAETQLPFSPEAVLSNGIKVVPQQYLRVERSRESVENIVAKIEFSEDYIFFVGDDDGVIYIQVGVIGRENYPKDEHQQETAKIVYGRKWLIEVNTPTSEVVQTALLALKKVREHEVREKIFLSIDESNKTTPFNTHLDLPLMADNRELFIAEPSAQSLAEFCTRIHFSGMSIELLETTDLGHDRALLKLQLNAKHEDFFPEYLNQQIHLVLGSETSAELLHELSSALIQISDRQVEEVFSFDGFKRFSREQCPEKLAEFSYASRNVVINQPRFTPLYKQMTHQVDSDRAPEYAITALALQQRAIIAKYSELDGHLPKETNASRTQLTHISNT